MSKSQPTADPELVDDIVSFYANYYSDEISKLAQRYPRDQKSLVVSYQDVYRFDMNVADDLRNHPDQFRSYFEEALRQFDLPVDLDLSKANVRFTGLPDTAEYNVGETRSDHLHNLLGVYGQVAKSSKIKPKLETAVFECQRCGTTTRVPQRTGEIQEPHECKGCERQGPFRIDYQQSDTTDHQTIRLQQPPEETTGGRGQTIDVALEDDLVGSVTAGDRVTVSGILKPDDDPDEVTLSTYVEANATQVEETDFDEIDVSEYEEEIAAIANDDPIDQLTNSLAPKLRGMETIKEALVLQLFGGVRSEYPDGSTDRGDFHVLLMGDPGCGKSTLLRAVEEIAPRSTYASGKGASQAGMTGAAVRDDFGDTEWGIEAGALVIANKGIACVDEIDKVDENARSSLHGALESQRVEIDKAGIDATLPAQTALLAAGNPKYGRFDPDQPPSEQIDLGSTLLSRFDLMFMLSDTPEEEEDRDVAKHMVESRRKATRYTHQNGEAEVNEITPDIRRELLRAYIAYAKQNVFPEIPEDIDEKIVSWYTELRQANSESPDSPVPVTARKVEAIERLAEASARARLANRVESEDIERAGRLVMKSMRDVGVDPETGQLDADVVQTGTSKSQRDRIKTVKNIIAELEAEYDEGAPIEVVLDEAMDNDISTSATKGTIKKLKDKGAVYEPRTDHLRTT